jgi:hypothetical protein
MYTENLTLHMYVTRVGMLAICAIITFNIGYC